MERGGGAVLVVCRGRGRYVGDDSCGRNKVQVEEEEQVGDEEW